MIQKDQNLDYTMVQADQVVAICLHLIFYHSSDNDDDLDGLDKWLDDDSYDNNMLDKKSTPEKWLKRQVRRLWKALSKSYLYSIISLPFFHVFFKIIFQSSELRLAYFGALILIRNYCRMDWNWFTFLFKIEIITEREIWY